MSLYDVLSNTPSLNITINGGQLIECIDFAIAKTKKEFEAKQIPEEYLTRKKAAQTLDMSTSSLWRWDKQNYLKPIKVGGKVCYKLSDIERIKKGVTV